MLLLLCQEGRETHRSYHRLPGLRGLPSALSPGRIVISWEPAWEIPPLNCGLPDWLIIGAQSGRNRRLPGREAVEEVVRFCGVNNVPVFCKDSIRKLWPDRE
jgi:protein gp37